MVIFMILISIYPHESDFTVRKKKKVKINCLNSFYLINYSSQNLQEIKYANDLISSAKETLNSQYSQQNDYVDSHLIFKRNDNTNASYINVFENNSNPRPKLKYTTSFQQSKDLSKRVKK